MVESNPPRANQEAMNEDSDDPSSLTAVLEQLAYMRGVADQARSTEGDPAAKWEANSILVRWLRTNCFSIIDSLSGGAELLCKPSGNAKQRIYKALMDMTWEQ